jgi:hypothetical protein
MCCSSPPPPPDLGPMAEASADVARIQQQTAREQLEWGREQDANNQELLQTVLDIQLPAMREQFEQAQSDRQRYETLFRPMEDAFQKEAEEYDSPERRESERAKALADTTTQFDQQRKNALSRLEGYGVDPSQTRNAALDIGTRTAQAAASVAAVATADKRVEDTGRALRSDAINMGRGALSNAAQFYGASVGAGGQAQQGQYGAVSSGVGALTSGQGFSGQALQGYNQSSNIMNSGFQNEMQVYQAEQDQTAGMMSAVGGMAGMFMADGGMPGDMQEGMPAGAPAGAIDPQAEVDTGTGDGSGIDDSVPAMLSDGEYVIPADVVRAKGEEFFDKLIDTYHVPAAEQRGAA